MPRWLTAFGVLVSFVALIAGTVLGIILDDTKIASQLAAGGSLGLFALALAVMLFDER